MTGTFSRYSGGLPGIGLLIVRATVGVAAILQSCDFVPGKESGLSPSLWVSGAIMCLAGGSLILGALTVWTSITIGVVEIAILCSLSPFSSRAISHSQASPLLVSFVALAVALIGPGAFSIDARLFGFREVKIPGVPPPSDL